jgi:hypothetical protein
MSLVVLAVTDTLGSVDSRLLRCCSFVQLRIRGLFRSGIPYLRMVIGDRTIIDTLVVLAVATV